MIEFKSLANVDSVTDMPDHYEFSGYVGAFGNVDSHGDILLKGASASQIGQTIHFFKDHYQEIGAMDIVGEDDYGIQFKARAPKSDPAVVLLAERVKLGAPYKFSIGFIAESKREINGVRYLEKIQLVEGSIVAYASNDNAVLTGIKSRHQSFVLASAEQKAVESAQVAALVAISKLMESVQ